MIEEEELTRRETKKIIRQCKRIARNYKRIHPSYYPPNKEVSLIRGVAVPIISSLLLVLIISLMICFI